MCYPGSPHNCVLVVCGGLTPVGNQMFFLACVIFGFKPSSCYLGCVLMTAVLLGFVLVLAAVGLLATRV